jgi:probable HAF family extracellular repeat protein
MVSVTLLPAVLITASAHGTAPGAPGPAATAAYQVALLPTLGGSSSVGNSINDRGWVAGRSNLAGDTQRHAALWRRGRVVDLGTLGGPNSSVLWPVKNTNGIISGISQTAKRDPLGERWSCAAFFPAPTATGHQCLGFRWEAGVLRALPTFGGTHGFAAGTNNRRLTVGWAENRVRDATCVAPQVLQFRAAVWGPKPDRIRQLPPLPGDTVSAATAINDRGQVVGISGFCDQAVGRFSAVHAVLWDRGRTISLGTLGGIAWNTPMSINQRGDVVGFSNVSAADAGAFRPHAFLWTRRDGIRDLGTLPGDVTSQALGVTDRLEVVGTSCDAAGGCRAFRWSNGVMTDLNASVRDPGVRLTSANDINDTGTITGQARVEDTGRHVAFRATPRR